MRCGLLLVVGVVGMAELEKVGAEMATEMAMGMGMGMETGVKGYGVRIG